MTWTDATRTFPVSSSSSGGTGVPAILTFPVSSSSSGGTGVPAIWTFPVSSSSSGGTGVPARVFPLGVVVFETEPWNAVALSVSAKTKIRERVAQSASKFLVFMVAVNQPLPFPPIFARLKSAKGNNLMVLRRFTLEMVGFPLSDPLDKVACPRQTRVWTTGSKSRGSFAMRQPACNSSKGCDGRRACAASGAAEKQPSSYPAAPQEYDTNAVAGIADISLAPPPAPYFTSRVFLCRNGFMRSPLR